MEEGEGKTNVGGEELHVKRATCREEKSNLCGGTGACKKKGEGEEEGRQMFVGAKKVSRIRKRREGRRGGRGGGRGGRGERREGKGGEGRG